MARPGTMRDCPMVSGTVGMAVKYATGMPTRSISLAIVAPQRLAVPQVALRRTASIPSLRRSAAISRPNCRARATGATFPMVT